MIRTDTNLATAMKLLIMSKKVFIHLSTKLIIGRLSRA